MINSSYYEECFNGLCDQYTANTGLESRPLKRYKFAIILLPYSCFSACDVLTFCDEMA